MIIREIKQIQKAKHPKKGIYMIRLEVTDRDIEMLEDLANCYCTKGETPQCELKEPYNKWTKKTYHEFHKIWRKYE